jgi:hypothetical protein
MIHFPQLSVSTANYLINDYFITGLFFIKGLFSCLFS